MRSSGSAASRPSTRPRRTSGSGAGWRASSSPISRGPSNVVAPSRERSCARPSTWSRPATTGPSRSAAGRRGRPPGSGSTRSGCRTPTLKRRPRKCGAMLAGKVLHRDELLELARSRDPERPTHLWNGLSAWVELVRAPPSGTWERRRADLYALAEDWLGAAGRDARSRVLSCSCADTWAASARRASRTPPTGRASRSRTCKTYRAPPPAPPPGRGRRRARRPAARTASRRLDTRARPLPPHLGRHAARPRARDPDPPGGVPPARLRHEDARTRRLPSSSTARSPGNGRSSGAGRRRRSRCNRSSPCRHERGASSATRPRAWCGSTSRTPSRTQSRAPVR